MKYQPKHMREEHGANTDSKHTDNPIEKHTLPVGRTPDSEHEPSLVRSTLVDDQEKTGTPAGTPDYTRVHPLGIPIPDPGDGGEYVPIPGKGSIDHIAPNGAVIRNPWSEQPEIKPDHAYTDEQQDQNLLIM
ncbi:hypothetical protein [Ruminococcus sp.]|uniref:hypothetical protein n=1 Tax=Ruminococcus sp. TaxID=41978 RepID=UPI002E8096C4|nr:hypothetical protein [Ruminococcus sp.]MEE3491741.1 hypothetical protein [Ruminococcus sp.]